jgi:formamidopyrimidine-DNA glycosylase
MPEGPEVRITAEALNEQMQYDSINYIYINPSSRYYKSGIKNQYSISYPIYINYVKSKGKKIIIDGTDNDGNNIIFVSALAMEGNWKLYSGKHSGIELHMTSGKTLYFHDTRHFGTFHICMTDSEFNFVMKDVGPDLLNDYVSFEDYNYVISKNKLGHKEICWFLMEQKFFSGVGNYIMAEILYESGILPTRKLCDLSDSEKYSIWENSVRILQASYECGGHTIATYFSMNGSSGTYPCKCYGRNYDPYGNKVYRSTFSNGRTSHYVPDVQF